MPNVLVIAKSFPPMRDAQAIANARVVQAIAQMGCQVQVVAGRSTRHSGYQSQSSHMSCPVHRVDFCDKYTSEDKGKYISYYNRLHDMCSQISSRSSWVRRAYSMCQNLVPTFRPDIILTQSTPFDSHLVGRLLKKEWRCTWIASFSDPFPIWIGPHPYSRVLRVPLLSHYQRSQMQMVLEYCDGLRVSNPYLKRLLQYTYRCLDDKPFSIIPEIGSPRDDSATCCSGGWISHIGNLTRERISLELVEGLTMYVKSNIHSAGLRFVGTTCTEFRDMIKRRGLEHKVAFVDRVPPEELRAYEDESSVLLVIEGDMEYSPFFPSKFADYVFLRKPILAITPKSSAIRYHLESFGGGLAVEHDRIQISEGLGQLTSPNSSNASGELAVKQLALCFHPDHIGEMYLSYFHQFERSVATVGVL